MQPAVAMRLPKVPSSTMTKRPAMLGGRPASQLVATTVLYSIAASHQTSTAGWQERSDGRGGLSAANSPTVLYLICILYIDQLAS